MADSRIVLSGISPTVEGLQWESDRVLRIGRMANMEILLNDPSVSRRHAEILFGAQGWVVADLGSSNGTFLNGVRVGRTFQKLRQHDVLQFGELCLSVKTLQERPVSQGVPAGRIRTTGAFVKLQAATSHSWKDAIRALGEKAEHRPERDKGFLALFRAGHHLCQIGALDELLHSVVSETVTALNAQRGCIILMDETVDQLQLRAVVSPSLPATRGRCFSTTLAERCYRQGQSLLCVDVSAEEDLAAASVLKGTMSSIICALLRSPRKRLGVLHLDRGPMQPPFSEEDFSLADAIAASVSTGIECSQLVEQQREQNIHIVTALAQAVELRDRYTAGHTQRVTTYVAMLAEELNFSREDQHLLQIGTPLHDIGKIGIPDSVLLKPGKLTQDEFEQIKSHTVKGAQILETIPDFANLIPIIRSHHERWDGTGYPDQLANGQISPLARIVAIADAFDAMTSDRPYRPALTTDQAFAELKAKAGKHFDPDFVEAFIRLRPRLEAVIAREESHKHNAPTMLETVSPAQLARILHDR